MLLAGRAQVDVRVDERREEVACRSPSTRSTPAGASMRAGRADLGDRAAADEDVVRRVDAGRAGRARGRRAMRTSAGGAGAVDERGLAHASGGLARASAAPLGRAGALEQLVEHRHPDDDAALDLRGDDRLRRVDDLAAQLDAAVDRAGVHEHLARVQAPAVDLEARGVLAQRRQVGLVDALVLHPQRVDDVGLPQVVEVVAHRRSRACRGRAGSASAARRP